MWCPSNYLTPHIESHPIPPIQQLSGTALRVRLENRLMADPTQHEAAERDVDHSLGYVDALFVVADEPAPADHPAQGPLDHPAARQDGEAWLVGEAVNDLDDEAEKGR